MMIMMIVDIIVKELTSRYKKRTDQMAHFRRWTCLLAQAEQEIGANPSLAPSG